MVVVTAAVTSKSSLVSRLTCTSCLSRKARVTASSKTSPFTRPTATRTLGGKYAPPVSFSRKAKIRDWWRFQSKFSGSRTCAAGDHSGGLNLQPFGLTIRKRSRGVVELVVHIGNTHERRDGYAGAFAP